MSKEFVNVIDDSLALLNKEEPIIVHEKGLLHIAVRSLLINSSEQVLLVQKKKDIYFARPFFDLTISEDVFSNDTPEKTIVENLFTNLNLKVDYVSLFKLGMIKEYKVFRKSKYIDNTLSYVFLIKDNIDIDAIKLNSDKINGFIWLDYVDFVKKFFTINYGGISLVNRNKIYYEIFHVLGIPPLK